MIKSLSQVYKEKERLQKKLTKLVDRLAEKEKKIYQLQIQLDLLKEKNKEIGELITIDWSKKDRSTKRKI